MRLIKLFSIKLGHIFFFFFFIDGNLYLDEHDDAIWNNINDLWKEFSWRNFDLPGGWGDLLWGWKLIACVWYRHKLFTGINCRLIEVSRNINWIKLYSLMILILNWVYGNDMFLLALCDKLRSRRTTLLNNWKHLVGHGWYMRRDSRWSILTRYDA